MALSSKDFRKLGLGALAVVVIIVVFIFSALGKGCSRHSQTRNTENNNSNNSTQTALTVKIDKVIASPTEKESITIVNTGNQTIDLKDWTLGDKNDKNARGLAGELTAGERKVYDHDSLGFGINDKNEVIYLKYKGQIIDKWEN